MLKNKYKNMEELPAVLKGEDIAAYLNVSRATGYNIMRSKGFPLIKIKTSVRVQKEAFLEWIEANINGQIEP